VKWNLEHGWMVGVDTNEKWEHFRNPFYFDDDSNLIYNCFMDTYSEGFQQAVRQIYEYSLNEHQEESRLRPLNITMQMPLYNAPRRIKLLTAKQPDVFWLRAVSTTATLRDSGRQPNSWAAMR
jgi:hypothetical protein